MREFNAYAGYPEPKEPRAVSPYLRTIQNRIAASYRDKEFYDGDRKNGYGGMKDDGRWSPICERIIKDYNLKPGDRICQLNAHKGFLLREFAIRGYPVWGQETSLYAIEKAVLPNIKYAELTALPFKDAMFDLVIAANAVYTLNLAGCIKALREIQRISQGRAWITLVAYEDEKDIEGLMMMRYWTLLGTTILTKAEWLEVMAHAGYTGDYCFHTSKFMNLVRA